MLITKYMGSKKAILDFVAGELVSLTEPGDILVDIMAGTHTIGYALKDRCKIVANDIQHYSRIIGETLLNYKVEQRFHENFISVFRRYYLSNLRNLFGLFQYGLEKERKLLSERSGKQREWMSYRDYCENYPFYLNADKGYMVPDEFTMLFGKRRVEAYQTLNKLEPYSMFSVYYGNSYMGIQQAAEIDSIRCAIDKLCDQWLPEHDEYSEIDGFRLRCFLVSVLIWVLNKINPGPGHWAAYPRVNERNSIYLKTQRSINVWDLFVSGIIDFENSLLKNTGEHQPHIVMNEDYVNFMEEVSEYIRKAKIVYLDPPYSQGHYSRFYHLIETLTLYDYPEISHQGRYRNDRHQSPFARKGKVKNAIGKICEIAQEGNTILVSSYSKGGVIADDEEFISILKNYYPSKKIKLKKLSSVHSKLGQSARMKTEEYLFICHP